MAVVPLYGVFGIIISYGRSLKQVKAAQADLPELLAHYPLLTDLKDVSGNGYDAETEGITIAARIMPSFRKVCLMAKIR